MSSAVYYKFKSGSSKAWDTVCFDGACINLLDLKRAIVKHKHLDKGNDDFDLLVSHSQTDEQYREDGFMIPKNTSVIVKRVSSTPQRSLVIKAAPNIPVSEKLVESKPEVTPVGDEEKRMMDLASQSAAQAPPPLPRRGAPRTGGFVPRAMGGARSLPTGYICRRCNLGGHYIKDCPTNGDPNFDYRRVAPPTGIPRSALVKVERIDDSRGTGRSALRLADGSFAIANPNEDLFNKLISSQTNTTSAASNENLLFSDSSKQYICPLCRDFFKNPVVTPCCFFSYCDECVRQALIADGSFTCPGCQQIGVNPDELRKNERLRVMVEEFLAKRPVERTRSPIQAQADSENAVESSNEITKSENEMQISNHSNPPTSQLESQLPPVQNKIEETYEQSLYNSAIESNESKRKRSGSNDRLDDRRDSKARRRSSRDRDRRYENDRDRSRYDRRDSSRRSRDRETRRADYDRDDRRSDRSRNDGRYESDRRRDERSYRDDRSAYSRNHDRESYGSERDTRDRERSGRSDQSKSSSKSKDDRSHDDRRRSRDRESERSRHREKEKESERDNRGDTKDRKREDERSGDDKSKKALWTKRAKE